MLSSLCLFVIAQLTIFCAVDAGRNRFTTLPAALSVSGANVLTYLDLSNCLLADIDSSALASLVSLVVLDLHNNRLRSLPDGIGALKALRELHLHNCAAEMLDTVGVVLSDESKFDAGMLSYH